MTAVGTVIEGKYEILKQIGKGGMSIVYLAMDLRLNKQWAVKEIKKRGSGKNSEIIVNSLLAEANLMKRLDHPALPRIVDIIDNGETLYVVMDYIEGEALNKILEMYGPQPQGTVIDWAKQLCDVLGYLHSQKPPIIYRDMKPANIILKPEGNLKVIDFGIAREYKEQNAADTTVLGTKGYAPPEQHGSRQTDARSDIYALGMTMHHLLTGVDPIAADYIYEPIRQWNPDLSGGLERVIDRCTALDPDARYQNCDELMYALEHYEEEDGVFKRRQKRKLRFFVASAILCFGFLVSGFVCRYSAVKMNNNNYEKLVSIMESTSLEEKISSYKQAIDIYPNNTLAYIKILEAYEAEGRFGKQENDEFLALYNKNKDSFDVMSSDLAELNYKTGLMYFNYYTDDNGEVNFSGRVQKAYSFFKENHDVMLGDFSQSSLSECYYQICSFYKTYILSSMSVEEASSNDYAQLLDIVDGAIKNVKSASVYDQLTLYNGIFMLLYDQRTNMASVNVDKNRINTLMERIQSEAEVLSVQKEQSQKLKNEIVNNYEEYMDAIERAYDRDRGE